MVHGTTTELLGLSCNATTGNGGGGGKTGLFTTCLGGGGGVLAPFMGYGDGARDLGTGEGPQPCEVVAAPSSSGFPDTTGVANASLS